MHLDLLHYIWHRITQTLHKILNHDTIPRVLTHFYSLAIGKLEDLHV